MSALESLVYCLFAWMTFEDQARKNMGNPLWVYFIKDALIIGTYLLCLRPRALRSLPMVLPRGLKTVLLWGLVIHTLGAVNPRLETPLLAAVTLKMTFFYVPLFYVGFMFARGNHRLAALLRTIAWAGAIAAAIGTYQALVDHEFLTPEPVGQLEGAQLRMTREEGIHYVTSTFLSPGRYVFFLLNCLAAAAALWAWPRTRRERSHGLISAALIVVGLATSGARAGIVALLLMLPLAYVFSRLGEPRRRIGFRPVSWRRAELALFGAVGALVLVALLSPAVANVLGFYWDSLTQDHLGSVSSRLGINLWFTEVDATTWLFGNGTGAASLGTQYLGRRSDIVAEGGYISTLWELGILGLVFYLALAQQVTSLFLRAARLAEGTTHRLLAITFGPLFFVELWYLNIIGPVLQQYVVAIFLWFFSGVLVGVRESGATR